MLINKDGKPVDSIYFIACCILEELRKKEVISIEELYLEIVDKYNKKLKYMDYSLSLNFLFLIDKIELYKGEIRHVY
ncbi:MAG: hypothetical protein M3Z48_00875 [Lactobacillus sp.]|uniref:ABC-three component system middle component 6 n=1 Tax=Bacillus cereus group TaxID=86661 RepID=UPI000977F1C0|nr:MULTISPECIES: ABC-three component system middle component 6 [Bacillus cereus group]MCT6901767.1 hypothetical protein [Lactobacillus sp.]MDA2192299.1 hypothetical protein [Bacillus cereus group sp. Bc238]MDA2197360.1 hypothetical protein [Bacillus cereus group sp. Bc237]MDA2377106.1 hypothetical protein [Bacillus cereus]ONG89786.1 hypothetical protein BKK40_15200 [Bacillus cereus]